MLRALSRALSRFLAAETREDRLLAQSLLLSVIIIVAWAVVRLT